MRKLLWFTLVGLWMALFSTHATAASADDARRFVDTVSKDALSVISNSALSRDQKAAKLEKIFSNAVDIPWVGKFVMGRYWQKATPDQRNQYLREYDQFITANYAGRFADYSGGSYTIINATDDGDGQYTVSTQMLSPDKQQVNVEYRIHKPEGGKSLKLFDVVVEGVSLITTQRSEFSAVLGNEGVDGLISKLKTRSLPQTELGDNKS